MKNIKKFESFNFKKVSSPKKDKVYLHLPFWGGDADTKHPEDIDLEIKFSEIENHSDEIRKEYEKYKILAKILEDKDIDYDEVKEKHGAEMARMWDNVPNDPQADYQFKCSLSSYSIKLIAYDKEGNKHESYLK
jgi:hypothetical protein